MGEAENRVRTRLLVLSLAQTGPVKNKTREQSKAPPDKERQRKGARAPPHGLDDLPDHTVGVLLKMYNGVSNPPIQNDSTHKKGGGLDTPVLWVPPCGNLNSHGECHTGGWEDRPHLRRCFWVSSRMAGEAATPRAWEARAAILAARARLSFSSWWCRFCSSVS